MASDLAAWIPYFAAAGLTLLLGVGLLKLDFGGRANRTFAVFLLFRATGMVLAATRSAVDDPDLVRYFIDLQPYFVLPIVPAAIWFALVYPRPRLWARSRHGARIAIAVTVLLELAYLLRHDLMWSYAPTSDVGNSYLSVAPGYVYTAFGPLALLLGLQYVALAFVAYVFARDFARLPNGSRRFSALLVCAGFTLNALFDGTLQILAAARLILSGESFPWLPWGWALVVPAALTAVPALAALVVVARAASAPGRPRAAVGLLAAAPLPVASALVLGALGARTLYLDVPLSGLVVGMWRLSLPLLVTWALVRYQLFDIDAKVKVGIRASVVTAAFLAVFFAASEVASGFVQERVGSAFGLGAAVALAFAFRPIERAAEGFAHRLLPGVKPLPQMQDDERAVFYREQAALAWQDGDLRDKERAMLNTLRQRLGLSAEAAARIDREVAAAAVA